MMPFFLDLCQLMQIINIKLVYFIFMYKVEGCENFICMCFTATVMILFLGCFTQTVLTGEYNVAHFEQIY